MHNPFKGSRMPEHKQLIELSLAAASKAIEKEKFEDTTVERARQKEGMRIKTLGSNLHDSLKDGARGFSDVSHAPEVYKELVEALYGLRTLTGAQTAVIHAANRIKQMQMFYLNKLGAARHTQDMRRIRKEYFGRAIGVVKQNKKGITLLHNAGQLLRKLPDFESVPTVIIAGLPNVGKTSLLKAITGSEPEVAIYPFTTRGLMLGYTELGHKRMQFIDTPGLLDRPLAKRNPIERQAIVALRLLADLIIYVWDPSETAGYTLEQQASQLQEIRKSFKRPVIEVANKSDIVGSRPAPEGVLAVSSTEGTGIEQLKVLINGKLKAEPVVKPS
jgi:nucleolar GTP-binding protein